MFTPEGYKERSAQLRLRYGKHSEEQNATAKQSNDMYYAIATCLMDDGEFSAIVLDTLSYAAMQHIQRERKVALTMIAQDSSVSNSNLSIPKEKSSSQTGHIRWYSAQLEGLYVEGKLVEGTRYTSPLDLFANQLLSTQKIPLLPQQFAREQTRTYWQEQQKINRSALSHSSVLSTQLWDGISQYPLLSQEDEMILSKKRMAMELEMEQSLLALFALQYKKNPLLHQLIRKVVDILDVLPSDSESSTYEYAAQVREYIAIEGKANEKKKSTAKSTAADMTSVPTIQSKKKKNKSTVLHSNIIHLSSENDTLFIQQVKEYRTQLELLVQESDPLQTRQLFQKIPWEHSFKTKLTQSMLAYALEPISTSYSSTSTSQQKTSTSTSDHFVHKNLLYALHYHQSAQQYTSVINTFMVSNLRLAVSMARKYTRRGYEFNDLMMFATEGLRKGGMKFDWQKGYKFSTYATWWMRQCITRDMGEKLEMIRVPVHARDVIYKMRQFRSAFVKEHYREPTLEELAPLVEKSLSTLQELSPYLKSVQSLDEKLTDDNDSSDWYNLLDGADGQRLSGFVHIEQNTDNASQDQERSVKIRKLLTSLHPREEYILRNRHGLEAEELTLEQIGEKLGVTRERIRQIESLAERKLKRRIEKEGLMDLAEGI